MDSFAVVFTGRNRVAWQSIRSPEPGPGDVVVDLRHSWISNGTEGSFLRGERISGDVAWRPGDPEPFPMVAGYQKVGRITAVGADVTRFAPGDWVFASMSRVTGMFDNVFAGHVSPSVCDASAVLPLPAILPPVAYAGLVLAQVGYNCGSRFPLPQGATAVILGDGLVGQWCGQTIASRGARTVVIGRHPDRLARFRRYGETLLADATEAAHALAAGEVHALIDTIGSPRALRSFLPRMARGGHIVLAGFYRPAGEVNLQEALQDFRHREISFHLPSGATTPRLEETMRRIASGSLDTLGCLSHRFPASRCAEAWELIASRQDGVLGVVLDWEPRAIQA
jgi:2-desacetyl-2-hydroxyethyl bacteriochlorophyllide A dehydrogenase